MPAGLNSRKEASLAEALRGLLDMGASTLRGAVVGTTGMPGDIEELVRALRKSESPRILPTSEEISEYLPSTGLKDKGNQAMEQLGQFVPTNVGKVAVKAAGPAATAMFVPALRTRTLKELREASNIKTPEELWAKHGLSKTPTKPIDAGDPAKFADELDDSRSKIGKDIPRLSPKERVELVADQFKPMQQPGAFRRALQLDLPRPGRYNLEDLYDHPELLDKFPEARKLSIDVINDPEVGPRGSYSPLTDKVRLNLHSILGSPDPGGGVSGVLNHEINHALFEKAGLPTGANSSMFAAPPEVWRTLEAYSRLPSVQKDLGPEGMRHVSALLKYKDKPPFQAYKNSPGEQYARAGQERFFMPASLRKEAQPHGSNLQNIYDEPDPQFARHLLGGVELINYKKLGPDALAQFLRSKQWAQLPPSGP